MLMPKKTKFRKAQRGTRAGRAKGGRSLVFGEYGLVALEPVWLTDRQIESVRVTVARQMKKGGQFYLRVFPDRPITKKPAETRMGKGKGNPEFWVDVVKRERVVCELGGLPLEEAKAILKQAAYKLPMKTKFISKAAISALVAQNGSTQ